ncbi:hypothetical protein [Methylobacterium sp. ARG-1]|uniref:hypothetical protein n=1 Tax=Methylobacterium sp. ARG-1 TaxID=1692501 RepID=UPI0006830AC2|nr:hypothetical protein [Methylobacterium sp. ARG-1]KNY21073.1 hypothetical protein AKJ13_18915 [Methylobacterium sp. ARG-1]
MVAAAMANRTDNSTPREMWAVLQAEIAAANLIGQKILAADIVHQVVAETLAEMLDEMNEETTR